MTGEPSFLSSLGEHWQIARTLRSLQIHLLPDRCKGIWECYEVCPVGCWGRDLVNRVAILQHAERCVACGACVLQCPEDAIELRRMP